MTDPPITAFAVHTPTVTPSDICSYYAKAALSHSVSCVVCLLCFFCIWGPSPHFGTTLETTLCPLSFGKSFMNIRSAVPKNGCLVFCGERKKKQKTEKNTCKTYTHPPHRRLRKLSQHWIVLLIIRYFYHILSWQLRPSINISIKNLKSRHM